MKTTTVESNLSVPKQDMVFNVGSLMSYLEQVVDPRAARGVRYRLVHLLTLLILAKLGGEDSIRGMADWVKIRGAELVDLLQLPRASVPHQTTYEPHHNDSCILCAVTGILKTDCIMCAM